MGIRNQLALKESSAHRCTMGSCTNGHENEAGKLVLQNSWSTAGVSTANSACPYACLVREVKELSCGNATALILPRMRWPLRKDEVEGGLV